MALFSNKNSINNFNKLKLNSTFNDLVKKQKTNFNISPYCLITKIPPIIISDEIKIKNGDIEITIKGDNIEKTLDEYMVEEHIIILNIIKNLMNYHLMIHQYKSLNKKS
jgi:hypothetical protein